jgi:hypothetical protein
VLWSLALFVAGQLALAVVIECWMPGLRDPRYACRAEQLIRRKPQAEPRPLSVVMLGSSRVQDGFNSSALEAHLREQFQRPIVVFNFGVPAAGPVANLLHLERLIAADAKPDLMLIEVAPMMLNAVAGRPQEAGYFSADRLWHDELDLVGRYGLTAPDLRQDWWQNWLVPCHAHRSAIASRLLPKMLPSWLRLDGDRLVDSSGWRSRNDQPLTADDLRRGIEYAWKDFGVPLQTFQLCESACRAQRDLLLRCREQQIAAALVWMPEGKLFQSWYPPAIERQIRCHLEELSEELEVPLIDARDWVDDDGFVDGQHLRPGGATQFSERLRRQVLEPILTMPRQEWGVYLASKIHEGESGRQPTIALRQASGSGASATR